MKLKHLLIFLAASLLLISTATAQWNSNPLTGTIISAIDSIDETSIISVTDGSGGAIVIMMNRENLSYAYSHKIFAQRISASGVLQWGAPTSEHLIASTTSEKYLQNAVPDGNGGAYICWADFGLNGYDGDVRLQHINKNGTPLWPLDGIMANRILASPYDVNNIRICSDGTGGVFICWSTATYDNLTGNTIDLQVMAQRYTTDGTPQWNAGGIQVCTATGFRGFPGIISDGNGNAIIAFADERNSSPLPGMSNMDVYAQKISVNGSLLWSAAGMPVITKMYDQYPGSNNQQTNSLVSDGAGGAIISLEDYPIAHPDTPTLIVQHLNSVGVRQWPLAGVDICSLNSATSLHKFIRDDAGGVVASWQDGRGMNYPFKAIYAQRILANGTPAWTTDGISVTPGNNQQTYGYGHDMCSDGNGNYLFVFSIESGLNHSNKAQKLNANGALQWGANAKDIATGGSSLSAFIVKSRTGTAIINWLDARNYNVSLDDIYAAKVASDGTLFNAFITATNGNWNTPATWIGGVVPPLNADVFIRHNVTLSTNVVVSSLTVQPPGGNITINAGGNITVLY